jgi:hypothetical protein
MAQTLPLILLRVKGDDARSLVVVSSSGRPPDRSIEPVEIVGQFRVTGEDVDRSVESFARGKEFTDFLHESIARNGPSLPGLVAAAEKEREGYVYIIDGRTPTPQGRVPNEDIIGAFQIREGKVSFDTYQRFEPHRLYTERGFFQLDQLLAQLVLEDLEARCGQRRRDLHQ